MSLINSMSFETDNSTIVKTMLLGEGGVGKTTFIERLFKYEDELNKSQSGRVI